MTQYQNLSGDSGISEYQIDNESVTVRFKNGSYYEYTYASAGRNNIEEMKNLATRGQGLNTFISQNDAVKHGYASKW